jgi:hypothetical protein
MSNGPFSNEKEQKRTGKENNALKRSLSTAYGACKDKAQQYARNAQNHIEGAGDYIWKFFFNRIWPVAKSSGFWTAAATLSIAITTIIYTIYARKQWKTMEGQLTDTRLATYDACVSAQISQRELVEAQKTNGFSQTMANASTMQAAAEIDTEKSHITFDARLPKAEELIENDPNFYIVYSVKNDGKSAANGVRIRAKATLLANDEVLKVNDRKPSVELRAAYLPAGESYPGTPEIGRPVTPLMEVSDSKGSIVAKDSEGVQKVFHDSGIIAVVGHISYSDFAGTHEARFCTPLWQMQAGTTRKGGSRPNERICAKYNQKQDHYTFTPGPPPTTSQMPLPNITCIPPRD